MTVVVKVKKMWHDLKEDKVRFVDEVFEMSDDRFEEVEEKLPGYNEKINSSLDNSEDTPQGEEEGNIDEPQDEEEGNIDEPQDEEETVEVPKVEKPKGKRKPKTVTEEDGKEE